MMARSTTRSNQRPDTLMQDRTSANSTKSSCNARPDHTLGSDSIFRRCPPDVWIGAASGPSHVTIAGRKSARLGHWPDLFDHVVGPAAIRGTGVTEHEAQSSVCLDAGCPDHLGPPLGFSGDEFSEIGGRARKRRRTQNGEPRFYL